MSWLLVRLVVFVLLHEIRNSRKSAKKKEFEELQELQELRMLTGSLSEPANLLCFSWLKDGVSLGGIKS